MSHLALKLIADVAEEHGPRFIDPDDLLLERLGLHVRVKAAAGSGETSPLFIGEFVASETGGRSRIGVTCVGMPPNGVTDAVANWCLGVLPVLAHWKGGHSCLAGTASFEAASGRFDVIKGPVVVRGENEGGAAPKTETYLDLLSGPLAGARVKRRLHWLECFAIRMGDGSVEATCRLDNRDWAPGQRLLAQDARGWPGSTALFDSRRQFLLLVPEGPAEPERPSFWSRLLGRG